MSAPVQQVLLLTQSLFTKARLSNSIYNIYMFSSNMAQNQRGHRPQDCQAQMCLKMNFLLNEL